MCNNITAHEITQILDSVSISMLTQQMVYFNCIWLKVIKLVPKFKTSRELVEK